MGRLVEVAEHKLLPYKYPLNLVEVEGSTPGYLFQLHRPDTVVEITGSAEADLLPRLGNSVVEVLPHHRQAETYNMIKTRCDCFRYENIKSIPVR